MTEAKVSFSLGLVKGVEVRPCISSVLDWYSGCG